MTTTSNDISKSISKQPDDNSELENSELVFDEPSGSGVQIDHGGEDDSPFTKYEDRYVAFLDILGFKELVFASARDESSVPLIYNALNIRHESVEDSFRGLADIDGSIDLDFVVQSFSDCIAASCAKTPEGLALLIFFCWNVSEDWLSKNFLSRGSISAGKLLHKIAPDGSSTLFGPAFIRAYQLESEVADYPRIIFSRDVRVDCANFLDPFNGPAWVSEFRTLWKEFDDGPTGIDLFSHLRRGGIAGDIPDLEEEVIKYRSALLSRAEEACDIPHFYRKVRWLINNFNDAIRNSDYPQHHLIL